jgi:hypothetical protein
MGMGCTQWRHCCKQNCRNLSDTRCRTESQSRVRSREGSRRLCRMSKWVWWWLEEQWKREVEQKM